MASGPDGSTGTAARPGAELGFRLAGIRWWIPLLYLAIGIGWILFSDRVVEALFAGAAVGTLQSLKGVGFVAVTAGGLWLLLRHHAGRIERAHRAALDFAQRDRQLLDLHPDPLWLCDAGSTRLLYINPAARAFFSLGAGEASALDATALQGVMPRPGEDGHPVSVRRIRLRDGGVRDVELHVARIEYDGRDARWVGMRDRSRETAVERSRAQALLRLKEAQRIARLGSWELDPVAGAGHVSEEACRMLGVREGVPASSDIRDLLTRARPDWTTQVIALFETALQDPPGRIDVVVPVPDAGGGERRLHLLGGRAQEAGTGRLLRGTLQDITEVEAARRRLRERDRQFHELIRLLPDGIMLVAGEQVRYANPACAAAFGRHADAMPGLDIASLAVPGDLEAFRAWLLHARTHPGQAGAAYAGTLPRMRRADGSAFNAALTASEARYEEEICTLVVVRDLTGAERMRDELADGNRQLQAVAARVFTLQEDERRAISRELHDEIGQAITAIKMSASAARDEDDPERRRDDIDDIGVLADATIERLRDISILLRPPQLDALGLEAALRWHAERLFRNAAPTLSLDIQALPERPDREIEQACFRIAQEALTNTLRHAAAHAVSLRLHSDGECLHLQVRDDGGGFDPGARGMGLGILIMRERAQGVGGEVAVVSAPGDGTRVDARLPRRVDAAAPVRERTSLPGG